MMIVSPKYDNSRMPLVESTTVTAAILPIVFAHDELLYSRRWQWRQLLCYSRVIAVGVEFIEL